MSNGGPPPECPECKVVINGRRISSNALIIAERVDKLLDKGKQLPPAVAERIVELLNQAEDLVDDATEALLRVNYSGPVNRALSRE
jgi:phosphate uptake regulator